MLATGLMTLSLVLAAMPGSTAPAKATPPPAEAIFWKIVAASARAEFHATAAVAAAGDAWSPLRGGNDLESLTSVRTADNGRATFTRQRDLILLDANSEVLLPEITPAGMTVILQKSGTALYKVAPGSATRRFEVRTPYL